MEEIKAWLKGGGGYDAGIRLYRDHGADKLLKRLFAEGWSEYKERRLKEALGALVAPAKPEVKIVVKNEASAKVEELQSELFCLQEDYDYLEEEKADIEAERDELLDTNQELAEKLADAQKAPARAPKGWPAQMDATVQELHDQWLPLFTEKKNLQSRLGDVARAGEHDKSKEEEAGAMAHRILDLRAAVRQIYKDRDHYLQYGHLPKEEAPMELPVDPKKWPKAIENYKRYLREYRAKLKKDPTNEGYQKQITKYEWGVYQLTKKMNGDAV